WDGKVVVMVWEHKHIADKKLTRTLRNLLNLDKLTGKDHVHETWQGSNYDYFWSVEYPKGSTRRRASRTSGRRLPVPMRRCPRTNGASPKSCQRTAAASREIAACV